KRKERTKENNNKARYLSVRAQHSFHNTVFNVGDIIYNKHYLQYYNNCCHKKDDLSQSTDLSTTDVIITGNIALDSRQQSEQISDATIDQPIQDINNFEMPTDENSVTTNNTNQEAINNGKITLSIKRGYGSHGFCFICKNKTGSKPMMVLPIEAIVEIYLK
ncbi:unnamed protein product, partial [Brachionus calyciflorus]